MQYTGNLKLKKPEGSDVVNIEDLNDNFDKLDVEVVKKATNTQDGRMSKEDKAKLNNIEVGANKYVHPSTHSLDMITETGTKKIMSSAERNKLAGIEIGANKYIHPTTHSADMIVENSNKRFASDTEKNKWNTVANMASKTYVDNNFATKSDLDKAGKVQSVNNKTGAVVLGKNDVGLGNLDNVRQATKQEFNNHVNGKFHIVESGSNSNGKYIKFADGTMICYNVRVTLTYLNSNSLAKAWNLPATFTSDGYACFATRQEAYYNDKSHAGLSARQNKTSVSLDLVSYGSSKFTSSNSMKVSCLAIGRWK